MAKTLSSDKNIWVIDRFEENFAVLENEILKSKSIPREVLPAVAKPGDALFFSNCKWHIDNEETAARRERIETLFARIKRRNQGDV